jgi:NADH-quinone oxidoreductase subunit G
MNAQMMYVDGVPVPIEGEANLLQLTRKAGVELPTFCYHSELRSTARAACSCEDARGYLHALLHAAQGRQGDLYHPPQAPQIP